MLAGLVAASTPFKTPLDVVRKLVVSPRQRLLLISERKSDDVV